MNHHPQLRAPRLTALICVMALFAGVAASAAPTDDAGPGAIQGPPAVQVNDVPEVLAMVAEDAAGAIFLPDLGRLEQRAAAMAKALGVQRDGAAAPVTTMLKAAGLAGGVDMQRGAALVMPDLNLMGQPEVVLVLPLADAAKFKANFDALAETEGGEGVMVGSPEGELGRSFVKILGGYALLAEKEGALRRYQTGAVNGKLWRGLGQIGRRHVRDNEATVYLNLQRVGPIVTPLLQMGLMQAKMQMKNNPDQAEAMGGPESAAAIIDLYGSTARAIFTDGRALTLGVSLDGGGGAAINHAIQFKPDTEAAKIFMPRVKPRLSMDPLPSAPTLVAMALDARAIDADPIVQALRATAKKMPDDSPMADILDGYADSFAMIGLIDQGALAWYTPTQKGEQVDPDRLFDFSFVYASDKPAELAKANVDYNQRMIKAMRQLAEAEGADAQTIEQLTKALKLQTDVAKVKGHQVDRFVMDLGLMAKQQGVDEMPAFLKKPIHINWLTTENAMLGATGEEMTLLNKTLAAAEGAGKLGQRSTFKMMRKKLPPHRYLEVFVDIESMARTFSSLAGEPNGGEFKNLGTMAMSMTSRAGGVGGTAYLPTGMVKSISEGVGAMMKMFMLPGGPMPGPGGGF